MERAVDLQVEVWRRARSTTQRRTRTTWFVSLVLVCALLSALLATSLPLQFSIVTVFLFAGPHNWFELRYFLMRLPARFGRSRSFFLVAFAGIGALTLAYASLPLLYYVNVWSGANWPTAIAIWNSLLLLWIAALVWMRGRQRRARDWFWAFPLALALSSLNWLAPELFSLAIVYLHPLVALWFLDRHLSRNRREWLRPYRRCLCLLPFLLILIAWQSGRMMPLVNDNGLAWRVTQHAGAELLPNVSSQVLVSLHVFLEMLHYGVWLIALPLIAPLNKPRGTIWDLKTIPLARRRHGFPRLVAGLLVVGLFAVAVLWLGFSTNYALTRDIYFTVAIAHVLAEAPFLLRMI
jgi:hypothetical protein